MSSQLPMPESGSPLPPSPTVGLPPPTSQLPPRATSIPAPPVVIPPAPASAMAEVQPVLLVGALIVGVSIFLEWGTEAFFGESFAANEIPWQLLWDTTPATFDSTSLIWALGLAVIAMLAGALRAKLRALAVFGSLLAVAVPLLYVNGVRAVHADPLYDIPHDIPDSIGIGTWVCVAAGAITLVVSIVTVIRERR